MQKTKRMRAALFTLLLLPGIFSAGFAAASPRSDILAQQSRAEAMAIILEASARNPGAFDNATLASYQNTLGLFNDALLVRLAPGVQLAYFNACASLFANVARQPEMANKLSALLSSACGTAADYPPPYPTWTGRPHVRGYIPA